MFAVAVAKVTNSLFPIFRSTPLADAKQCALRVVGSGFFVDTRGTFVTVAHLFDNAAADATFEYRGRSPDHFQNPTLSIVEVDRDEARDVLVGRVNGLQLSLGLDLAEKQAEIGTSVCVAGYPLSRIEAGPQGGVDVTHVRRYFQNTMIVDRAACQDAGTGRRHEGFMMTEFSLFGMSGGPVVAADGTVVGMQASVTKPRISEGAGGRKISIENAIAIDAQHIVALLARVAADMKPAAARA